MIDPTSQDQQPVARHEVQLMELSLMSLEEWTHKFHPEIEMLPDNQPEEEDDDVMVVGFQRKKNQSPRKFAWICCLQLPYHPCKKNGTHGTSFCNTRGHTLLLQRRDNFF